jgi:Type IV secretion system pilin
MRQYIQKSAYAVVGTLLSAKYAFAQLPTTVGNRPVTGGRPAELNPADGPGTGTGAEPFTPLKSPISAQSLDELISNIIDLILFLAVPILVCVFIWIGLRFVLAQGKPREITKIKSDLLWTLVGAAVVIGAKAIQVLVTGTIESVI